MPLTLVTLARQLDRLRSDFKALSLEFDNLSAFHKHDANPKGGGPINYTGPPVYST